MRASFRYSLALALSGALGLPGRAAWAQAGADNAGEHGVATYYLAPASAGGAGQPATQEAPVAPAAPAQTEPAAQYQSDAQPATLPPIEQRRRFARRLRVRQPGQAFSLDTRYGKVRVNAWSRPEIKVEAELIARAETPATAAALLDGLGVQWLDYDAHTGGPAVATQFGPGLKGKCSGGCRYEVNYTVWLPATTALRISTSFAAVTLAGDWQGPVQLAVNYGSLRTDRLLGAGSTVRIANGDATLPFVRQAALEADYARLRVDEGEQLTLRTNYADVDLRTVQDLVVHSKYGDVALGSVRNLRGSSGYSRFSVAKLSEGLDMAVRYCPDFEVRDMGANFKRVTLDGDNSTIRLGFAEATPGFRFDVSTEQGQLLVDKKLVHILQQGENQPGIADVLGVYGGGRVPGPRAGNVNIRVRNGTVRFSK
ncbi:hypothetical protein HHL22_18510 [Hymenobacter sp. RP-2-7]|uniref:Adhesin domain-containing protein n=1 Tax=Hymenobacter polaris TaxID=2682546 RepID=A0A7Y0AHC1_9BACT|nr:hypothetical protein [Hymenobacter polaris]NML67202.1 hypothetical protein [Hymenobacter polaris]